MAEIRSFDCTETDLDLLCDEETNGFCFDDGGGDQTHVVRFDPAPPLTEESVGWLVERERAHLPKDDYLNRLRTGELDMSLRRQALDWIFKACCYHNFGELCLFLAVNYLDRFLSVYSLPEGKDWVIQLVAVSCLSLAAKLDEVKVPCMVDLQVGESNPLFEGKAVQRMEVLVMNYLNWNMKACTPFSFMDYFLKKANSCEIPQPALIRRSTQIILSTIKGIDFLEFKPSEIAAAVAVHVSREMQAMDIDKALSDFICVEKGRAMHCLELIRDLISVGESTSTINSAATTTTTTITTGSIPRSPNGVLDAAFWSYKNENVERTVGSCPSPSHNTKRRKLDHKTTLSGGS